MTEWMELNPDYRRPTPKTSIYCCRCQKDLNALKLTGFKSVQVDYDTLKVRENSVENMKLNNATIGLDCWKQVLKENK